MGALEDLRSGAEIIQPKPAVQRLDPGDSHHNARLARKIGSPAQGSADGVGVEFSARPLTKSGRLEGPSARCALEVAQNPIALGAALEFFAFGFGGLGIGYQRQ